MKIPVFLNETSTPKKTCGAIQKAKNSVTFFQKKYDDRFFLSEFC